MSIRASRIECQFTPLNGGPFGRHPRHSAGHVLNALCDYGIPLHVVEQLQFQCGDKLNLSGKHFATYAYFEGVEHPIFGFKNKDYYDQECVEVEGVLQADFRLNLYAHQTNAPALLVPRHQYSDDFPKFLSEKIFYGAYGVRDEDLRALAEDARAKFQWGYHAGTHEYIHIQVWYPAMVRPLIHRLNQLWQTPTTRQYLH